MLGCAPEMARAFVDKYADRFPLRTCDMVTEGFRARAKAL